ncbi:MULTISPECIES: N-acetylmuramoyl-L-alanine amidase family protein [unclassified Clostridium]|uniref:N-acetylmuramoyl-L-alanine amidase family protein n=1 Tax=unclassified Clostridium TaxID=2614128 RepID=UPI000297CE50|nr:MULTISPECIES: N-acetylmuramoyl-L-alanine amidase family protein [unclassified Clostridium]EKQ58083.1 MAG: putative cell wall binding protein [Clostridium sp. Maddingley MBC34-26]
MINRRNKITALLVAATSIMSIVPAMAATKLGTKDGTIEKAVAFKDGKYIYQGYRTDDDDLALYYNAGDKDKKLDTVTDLENKYSDKYVQAFDGSDEYIVDLSTGTLSDSDTVSDLTSTAKVKLQEKLSKTSRYGKGPGKVTIAEVTGLGSRFGAVWYSYSATTSASVTTTSNTTTYGDPSISYTGYVDQLGNYIDCSKNENIYVYNGTKMVKLENLGDTSDGVTLDSITYLRTLSQDDKYIYRLISASVTGAVSVKTGAADTTLYYVQRISKEQGDKEKDAYLPKSTESFQIEGAANIGNSDVGDAYNAIDPLKTGIASYTGTKYYMIDGSLYVTFWEDGGTSKVKTIKLNFKNSAKLDEYSSGVKTGKLDGHVIVKDSDKDQKANAWVVDSNKNVWALYEGEILKSAKLGDFNTIYTCDRSFDKIDVYDDNNLIAWDNSGKAYTTVTEGTKQSQADAATIVTPAPAATIGWKQDGTNWTFFDATGTKVVNKWVNVDGAWYFLKADGVMATGWINNNGTWYYLKSSGAMATGWINDNGTWYYLNASGAMLANTTVDGYTLNASGAWVK